MEKWNKEKKGLLNKNNLKQRKITGGGDRKGGRWNSMCEGREGERERERERKRERESVREREREDERSVSSK